MSDNYNQDVVIKIKTPISKIGEKKTSDFTNLIK